MIVFASLIALVMVAGCRPADAPPAASPLQITDARVRAVIPGQDKTVGYFTAFNAGNEALVLTGARSDAVRTVEIHVTLRDGDMVRMRRLEDVVIEAGGTVRFEPGGRHLMLFGAAELETPVEITLLLSDGAELSVPFRVSTTGEI